jgi:hypothetical protein
MSLVLLERKGTLHMGITFGKMQLLLMALILLSLVLLTVVILHGVLPSMWHAFVGVTPNIVPHRY